MTFTTALGHTLTTEQRPAQCCDRHRDTWATCSCGWEKNVRHSPAGSVSAAFLAHRVTVIEHELALNQEGPKT